MIDLLLLATISGAGSDQLTDSDAPKECFSAGTQWFHDFGYEGIVPRLPGDYEVVALVKTPKGLWRMPPVHIRIVIPEGEEEAYSAMLAQHVPLLLEHPSGMRSALALVKEEAWWGVKPSDVPDEERLPYEDVLSFVQKYPDSVFTRLVYDRCYEAYLKDRKGEAGRMGVIPPSMHADRVEIARLLMTIDPEKTVKTVERQIAVFERALTRRADEKSQHVTEGKLYWYQCWAQLIEEVKTRAE